MSLLLTKVSKKLKEFTLRHLDENVLEVTLSSNPDATPICHLVTEDQSKLLVSFTVEPIDAVIVIKIYNALLSVTDPVIAESFYVNQSGEMTWGQEAYENFMLEVEFATGDIQPINDLVN